MLLGEQLLYSCLLIQSRKSSTPKGPEFIIWSFCFVAWIETQRQLGIQTALQNTSVCHVCQPGNGRITESRASKTKEILGISRLFSATIHIRFNHVTSTTSTSECLTSLAVTEIGAEPKYSHFERHPLGEFFFLPLLICTTCVCQVIYPRSFFAFSKDT